MTPHQKAWATRRKKAKKAKAIKPKKLTPHQKAWKTRKSKIKTLVLKNSEWMRGTGAGELYSPKTNKLCCLGIFGRDFANIPCSKLENIPWPSHLTEVEYKKYIDVCPGIKAEGMELAIGDVNDDFDIDDRERIKLLDPLWRKLNVKIEFRRNE